MMPGEIYIFDSKVISRLTVKWNCSLDHGTTVSGVSQGFLLGPLLLYIGLVCDKLLYMVKPWCVKNYFAFYLLMIQMFIFGITYTMNTKPATMMTLLKVKK